MCWIGAAPIPVAASVTGVLEELVTNEIVADALPLLCGLNVIVKDADDPAGMVTGSVGPVRANSALLDVAEFTVTLDPEAMTFSASVWLAPTVTLPKLSVPGETLSVPTAVPVPDNVMGGGAVEAVEVKAMLPPRLPADCGSNTILKVKLSPAERFSGRVKP